MKVADAEPVLVYWYWYTSTGIPVLYYLYTGTGITSTGIPVLYQYSYCTAVLYRRHIMIFEGCAPHLEQHVAAHCKRGYTVLAGGL